MSVLIGVSIPGISIGLRLISTEAAAALDGPPRGGKKCRRWRQL